MKKTLFLLWALLLCNAVSMNAQVRIGGDTVPHAAAVLDLNANNDSLPAANKGALALPRVSLTTSTARLNNAVPANGMMVYNTGGTLSAGIYSWNGTQWLKVQDNSNSVANTIAPLITWVPVNFRNRAVSMPATNLSAYVPSIGISVFGTDTCALVVGGLVDAVVWDPGKSTPRKATMLPTDYSGPYVPAGYNTDNTLFIGTESSGTMRLYQALSMTPPRVLYYYPPGDTIQIFVPCVCWKLKD